MWIGRNGEGPLVILRASVLWYWFLGIPALFLSAAAFFAQLRKAKYAWRELEKQYAWTPPATVIVSVKGQDEGLRENLAALAALDYPDYELIVVAHSADDIPRGVLPSGARVVLAHGADPQTAEKVQNLLAAVRA